MSRRLRGIIRFRRKGGFILVWSRGVGKRGGGEGYLTGLGVRSLSGIVYDGVVRRLEGACGLRSRLSHWRRLPCVLLPLRGTLKIDVQYH